MRFTLGWKSEEGSQYPRSSSQPYSLFTPFSLGLDCFTPSPGNRPARGGTSFPEKPGGMGGKREGDGGGAKARLAKAAASELAGRSAPRRLNSSQSVGSRPQGYVCAPKVQGRWGPRTAASRDCPGHAPHPLLDARDAPPAAVWGALLLERPHPNL